MPAYEYAVNPKRFDSNSIQLDVKFYENEFLIPFIASEDDLDDYSKDLYQRSINGDFGEIQNTKDYERKIKLDEVILKISNKRNELMLTSGCKIGNYWFQSSLHHKMQQMGLLLLGANIPLDTYWTTMSDEKVLLTPELVQQIFIAQTKKEEEIFKYGDVLIEQAKTMEFPENLDLESGWPESFSKG